MQPEYLQNIRSFYEETLWIVSTFWTNQKVLATHVGYWEAHTRNDREAQAHMNSILAGRVAIQSGERVLDAGCGMGGSALWLAQNRGANVFGVTVSPGQAALATRAASRYDLSNCVSFSLQNYTATTFPDETFDVVWAIESVCYAPAKSAFFEEAFRVLRPGGRLIIADGFRSSRVNSEADERLLRDWLEGWALQDVDTPEEFVAAAHTAGFAAIHFDDESARVRPSIDRLHLHSRWSAPICSALSHMRLLSPVVARAMWANGAFYEITLRGLTNYGMMSAAKPR